MVKKVLKILAFAVTSIVYIAAVLIEIFKMKYAPHTVPIIFLTGIFLSALSDLKEKAVPVIIPAVTALLTAALNIWQSGFKDYLPQLIAAAVILALFAVLSFLTKGRIGMADAFIIAVCALFYGFAQLLYVCTLAFFFSSVAGIVYSLVKKDKTVEIPFVPFVLLAAMLVML